MKTGVVWKDKLWVLTAPVHSGKTTFLQKWVEEHNAGGFLTPDIDDLRVFHDLSSNSTIPFEVKNEVNEATVAVGKYSFLKSAFDYGNARIKESIHKDNTYFIIDEAGKLEMNDQGFATGIEFLINHLKINESKTTYIIVVRDYLLSGFLEKYELKIKIWEEMN